MLHELLTLHAVGNARYIGKCGQVEGSQENHLSFTSYQDEVKYRHVTTTFEYAQAEPFGPSH